MRASKIAINGGTSAQNVAYITVPHFLHKIVNYIMRNSFYKGLFEFFDGPVFFRHFSVAELLAHKDDLYPSGYHGTPGGNYLTADGIIDTVTASSRYGAGGISVKPHRVRG